MVGQHDLVLAEDQGVAGNEDDALMTSSSIISQSRHLDELDATCSKEHAVHTADNIKCLSPCLFDEDLATEVVPDDRDEQEFYKYDDTGSVEEECSGSDDFRDPVRDAPDEDDPEEMARRDGSPLLFGKNEYWSSNLFSNGQEYPSNYFQDAVASESALILVPDLLKDLDRHTVSPVRDYARDMRDISTGSSSSGASLTGSLKSSLPLHSSSTDPVSSYL